MPRLLTHHPNLKGGLTQLPPASPRNCPQSAPVIDRRRTHRATLAAPERLAKRLPIRRQLGHVDLDAALTSGAVDEHLHVHGDHAAPCLV